MGKSKLGKGVSKSEKVIPFPDKKYQIIYADPPWMEKGWNKGGAENPQLRGANRHYSLMTTEDIALLPVKNIAADDSHLYLWVTNNFLPDGLLVMQTWGFTYKTIITWFKGKMGLGQYFRGMTEHCLFGVRGMIPYKTDNSRGLGFVDERQQGLTGFFAERKGHSEKPEEMREMITRVSYREGCNRIELFARRKTEGWDVWGTEVQRSERIVPIEDEEEE